MDHKQFDSLFGNLSIPVLICRMEPECPLVYCNTSAKILLNPMLFHENMEGMGGARLLSEMLRFRQPDQSGYIYQMLETTGALGGYAASVVTFEDKALEVSINANRFESAGRKYFSLYLSYDRLASQAKAADHVITLAHHVACNTLNVHDAINKILEITGAYARVNRAYIFEDMQDGTTRNTYEWCAPGTEPAIQDLQCLRKEDYNYDVIIGGGMYVTDDVRELPGNDREILERQGIKSLAILPLYSSNRALGYIGFDDCEKYRKWSAEEVRVLQDVAGVVVSLIMRRKSEEKAMRSLDILQTISDNMDNIIYVSDVENYEVVFINKTLADSLGKRPEDIIGQTCWKVLQKDKTGPCEFCPLPYLRDEAGNYRREPYAWEFQNTINKKWYLVYDSIIKWIDGRRDVHIETAVEITHRKKHEEQLEYYASTDVMTGAFNREWGYKIIGETLRDALISNSPASLCFIDLDGLKFVNDTFGHHVGDDMLIQLVRIVRGCIRKSDAVCRWGGDEFILLLGCHKDNAIRVIDNVNAAVDSFNGESGKPYKLSFSYGIVDLNEPDTNVDDIILKADQLMYLKKMSKRRK